MGAKELEKVYDPKVVEDKWSAYWQERGFFTADTGSERPPFSMVIPPPNVTGSLHMGHALNNTLQDIVARYKRMEGFNVLWLPGMDHAGIATQNVVERMVAKEGIDRHALGREKFIERVWKWKEESGGTIINQLKRLGASCDWSREQFTMSPELTKAVREVFVRLYEEGLIYRDSRLINWCPRCLTALSDIEVEHEEAPAKLYHVRYHLVDDKGKFLTVATTRPETMLGDTAVAVHPEDERFSSFIGKKLRLPLTSRNIPVIADEMVDREFGTGSVKITPAHDFNDFEAGKRHDLERIAIFDERAHVIAGIEDIDEDVKEKIEGLHANKAREKVIHLLKERGFLTKAEDYTHAVGRCYRCKTVVEPHLSPQWFVKAETLAREAIKAVEDGTTTFVPKGWENTYFEWMRNIKEWCISRQIWWGHQIPAWYCTSCNADATYEINGERKFAASAKVIVSREEPDQCPSCGGVEMVRESDVLDTWFSSALWPFSTLGWPDGGGEMERYYPTALLVTGFDIIFFWVARMMMMGLKFMGEVPFATVYIHALVRDMEGQKMSKSKGNVIDPLVIMDQYGTDAFRFTLAAMASQGRDIKLAEERIEGYRNFCNKIWNLARFTLMNLDGFDPSHTPSPSQATLADRWILARLNSATEAVGKGMNEYRFNDVADASYRFVWHELCDWYVEMIKGDLRGSEEEGGAERRSDAQATLVNVLRDALKLLHPTMPFITEEIWEALPRDEGGEGECIMVQAVPVPTEGLIPEDEADMELIMDIVRGVRNIRSEMNVPPSLSIPLICRVDDDRLSQLIKSGEGYLTPLARLSSLEVSADATTPPDVASAVVGSVELYIPLKGLVDVAGEEKRLLREIEKIEKERGALDNRLSNKEFVANAPEEVVARSRERLKDMTDQRGKLEEALKRVRRLKE
ncbi:MAG: valine--tRNA ligase [Deltaproteobacteria bacterium]|nr:valine--tRNA ligase [Deltaproteobacteria bacterium]